MNPTHVAVSTNHVSLIVTVYRILRMKGLDCLHCLATHTVHLSYLFQKTLCFYDRFNILIEWPDFQIRKLINVTHDSMCQFHWFCKRILPNVSRNFIISYCFFLSLNLNSLQTCVQRGQFVLQDTNSLSLSSQLFPQNLIFSSIVMFLFPDDLTWLNLCLKETNLPISSWQNAHFLSDQNAVYQ